MPAALTLTVAPRERATGTTARMSRRTAAKIVSALVEILLNFEEDRDALDKVSSCKRLVVILGTLPAFVRRTTDIVSLPPPRHDSFSVLLGCNIIT